MTTPYLDATSHQWVGVLAKFTFQLEYQKGQDNTVADRITICLGLEAMQSILDGATLGAAQRAKGDDPAMVEGDQEKEKEVLDPELDVVLCWLEAKKKTDLRTLLREHASSEEGRIVWRNHQNFTVLEDALYLCSMPKRGE